MKEAMAVPVSEWGPGMAVSLPTVARRWGLTEDESLELFGLTPSIGNEVAEDGGELYDGEVTICVAETGERLWMANYILFAEGDFPGLAKGRGREVLVAMRALSAAVDAAWSESGWYSELLGDHDILHEGLSVDRLAALASMEPTALRAEHERLVGVLQAQVEQIHADYEAQMAEYKATAAAAQ